MGQKVAINYSNQYETKGGDELQKVAMNYRWQ